MCQRRDRQPPPKPLTSKMSKRLQHLSAEAGFADVYRCNYPRNRDFTFYSHRHSSYSRIDLFFTPKEDLYRIKNIEILSITVSDHAPVVVSWDIGDRPETKQWRLNASLLNDKGFITFVSMELWTVRKHFCRVALFLMRAPRKRELRQSKVKQRTE